jgi:hypothetical protein
LRARIIHSLLGANHASVRAIFSGFEVRSTCAWRSVGQNTNKHRCSAIFNRDDLGDDGIISKSIRSHPRAIELVVAGAVAIATVMLSHDHVT